jgi:hypothetical protein
MKSLLIISSRSKDTFVLNVGNFSCEILAKNDLGPVLACLGIPVKLNLTWDVSVSGSDSVMILTGKVELYTMMLFPWSCSLSLKICHLPLCAPLCLLIGESLGCSKSCSLQKLLHAASTADSLTILLLGMGGLQLVQTVRPISMAHICVGSDQSENGPLKHHCLPELWLYHIQWWMEMRSANASFLFCIPSHNKCPESCLVSLDDHKCGHQIRI